MRLVNPPIFRGDREADAWASALHAQCELIVQVGLPVTPWKVPAGLSNRAFDAIRKINLHRSFFRDRAYHLTHDFTRPITVDVATKLVARLTERSMCTDIIRFERAIWAIENSSKVRANIERYKQRAEAGQLSPREEHYSQRYVERHESNPFCDPWVRGITEVLPLVGSRRRTTHQVHDRLAGIVRPYLIPYGARHPLSFAARPCGPFPVSCAPGFYSVPEYVSGALASDAGMLEIDPFRVLAIAITGYTSLRLPAIVVEPFSAVCDAVEYLCPTPNPPNQSA